MPRIERFADARGDKHGDPCRRQFDDQSALRKEREQLAVHFEAVGAKLSGCCLCAMGELAEYWGESRVRT